MKKPFFYLLLLGGLWFTGQSLYIHAKALLAQQLLERAWQKNQHGENRSRPWPWADTWPLARLRVPRLDIDLIVLAGDSGRTLAFGPGHHFGSAQPGEIGHSIISAHRDTHFRFLQHLRPNDLILLETRHGQTRFRVDSSQVVQRDQAMFYDNKTHAYLHLVTCYPFDALSAGGSQRFIVSAVAQNKPTGPSYAF